MPSKSGGAVEIVLGVSMTPTTVSIALVEGAKADGVILERDVFDIAAVDGSATSSASDHVIAAVLGTQEGAIAAGHNLVSTGVTWTDHSQAAELREALVARGIEDVLLVSELHAAAALAQAVGRAVGYDKTALMFVERDNATLAVVETADGSVVKVVSKGLQSADTVAVLKETVTSLQAETSMPQGIFVVGSNVDVTAVKAQLQDLVSVPVVAPEEPELALARGAALASANAPRYDTSTIGLAYSQDPDLTTAYLVGPADDATTFLGYAATPDASDIAFDSDDVPEHNKPFLLMGSSLTAIFAAGVTALVIAMVVNLEPTQPTLDQGSGEMTVRPSAATPPPTVQSRQPAAPPQVPNPVPDAAPGAPPPAAAATARRMVPPAPPPQVLVRNAAPAPAAPPPAPAPPPPVVIPPRIPPPLIQWLPPFLQPPQWQPGWDGPPSGRGGEGHRGSGHGDDDDHRGGRKGRGGD
jgi:hypothetical protein